jgi:hypothetical protein
VSTDLDQARRAVRRGAADEALVFLWNALEPARLAGDGSALETIGRLAHTIAEKGDSSQRRDAERLLETLQTAVAEDEEMPATARLDADLSPVAETLEEDGVRAAVRAREGMDGEAVDPEGRPRGGIPFGTILWFAILAAVIVMNALRRLGE